MQNNYLLENSAAVELYKSVKDLPIYDYHCHLSPKEIWEDLPFENIGQMWLGGDHYKWRLMRTFGVEERLITGDASWMEKFIAYIRALSLAAGNPLYAWSRMELDRYFGIDLPIREDTAEQIWELANAYLKKNRVSPRSLIEQSRVAVICTTDDPADTLEYHKKLKEEGKLRVLPSYRTDQALQILRPDYAAYLKKLEGACQSDIRSLSDFCSALVKRLDHFEANGCRCTDVGIPVFPDRIYDEQKAAAVFADALKGLPVTPEDYNGFLGYMYRFLGGEYRKRDMMMQWHLAVYRNASSAMFASVGADCGCDCVADPVPCGDIIRMLDAIDRDGGLPQTVLYTLNGSAMPMLASVAGSFRNVRCGTAWWFCDHRRGIEDAMQTIAENSCFGSFFGMLTDSRSFLSYARHDYFRRIACNLVGKWVEQGEYDGETAVTLLKKICCENISQFLK